MKEDKFAKSDTVGMDTILGPGGRLARLDNKAAVLAESPSTGI